MNLACVILAAGRGTRMNSTLPKVLNLVNNKPLIYYPIKAALNVNSYPIILIVGYEKNKVISATQNFNVQYAFQIEQLGTGHAVMQAEELLKDYNGNILVLLGDMPLISSKTIQNLKQIHEKTLADVTLLTGISNKNLKYGRIIRNHDNEIIGIVEEKDCNEKQRLIREVNPSVYLFKKDILFSALKELKTDNVQNEYYLTDVISILKGRNAKISSYLLENSNEILGVNTLEQLEEVSSILISSNL